MISMELRELLSKVRGVLPQDPEWVMMNDIPKGFSGDIAPGRPTEYIDFLHVANGAILGRIVIFDATDVDDMQYYADPIDGAPKQLDRDNWFCFGKVDDDPLFVRRSDGSVWGTADTGVIWWQSAAFQSFSDDLDGFFRQQVFGEGYAPLVNADENDQWWRLLRHIGRVS